MLALKMVGTTQALLDQGYLARREQRADAAKSHFAAALAMAETAGDARLSARAQMGLGQVERDHGNLDGALQHYRQAVALDRKHQDALCLAHALRHVGDIQRKLMNTEDAECCYKEALAIYRTQLQTKALDLANALRGYALLEGQVGHDEGSTLLWLEAMHLYEQEGIQAGVSECQSHLAFLMGR